ncbi:MAG: hypothetical protein KJO07_16230, partial [Deltaproteobacteria bacterium]|nr:hypothetical protein [Deltaproteobacteria bacterium]
AATMTHLLCTRLTLISLTAALTACAGDGEPEPWDPGTGSSDISSDCPDGDCSECAPDQIPYQGDCYANVCAELAKGCGYLIDDYGEPHRCGECLGDAECGPYNECLVDDDRLEPNNDLDGAYDFGEVNEGFETSVDGLVLSTGDEDWFMYHVNDGPGFLGLNLGNPQTMIKLGGSSDRWSGDVYFNVNLETEHELTAWWQCDTAEEATVVKCGTGVQFRDFNEVPSLPIDEDLGVGCRVQGKGIPKIHIDPQCETTDDSGWIIFRVRRPSQDGSEVPQPALGDGYSLKIITG